METREVSAESYRFFITEELIKLGGVATDARIMQRIEEVFSPYWAPADRRAIKGRKTPKWQNMVDWVKATCGKHHWFYYRDGIYVLNPSIKGAPAIKHSILLWVITKDKSSSYSKRCPKCRKYQPLATVVCKCGHHFSKNERRHVIPA
jgi:hypothetical protein